MYPSQGPKIQDSSKQSSPSLNGVNQTVNHQIDDWKEKKNKYASSRSTPVDSLSVSINLDILNDYLKIYFLNNNYYEIKFFIN